MNPRRKLEIKVTSVKYSYSKSSKGSSSIECSIECSICNFKILQKHQPWICKQCTNVFHLTCIEKWVNYKKPKEDSEIFIWDCPLCRFEVSGKPVSYCYCGKTISPEFSVLNPQNPYSCGNSCSKTPHEECPHSCCLQCHSGACPPCNLNLQRKCFCGKHNEFKICSNLSPNDRLLIKQDVPSYSCKDICKRKLNCGLHFCELVCHNKPCSTCQFNSGKNSTCYCGKSSEELKCGFEDSERFFTCGKVCNNLLDCENHYCQDICHQGACKGCLFLPSLVKTCPCGKTRIIEHQRESCTSPILCCSNVCDKILKCKHKCKEKCHSGECPPCQEKVNMKCKCNKTNKMVLCAESFNSTNSCQTGCKKKLHCKRHICKELCCDLPAENHYCVKTCNIAYPCGLHNCNKPCHKTGQCGECNFQYKPPLFCMCKKIKVTRFLKCGERFPQCMNKCPNIPQCGHEHKCHSMLENCMKCQVLVQKHCKCKKTIKNNVVCSEDNITCNNTCDKLLPCSNENNIHKCTRSCHSGECTQINKEEIQTTKPYNNYHIDKETGRITCLQKCKIERSCKHPCNNTCHGQEKCPQNCCNFQVFIYCSCKNNFQTITCHKDKKIMLECNTECKLIERNKIFAESLGLDLLSNTNNGFFTKKNQTTPQYTSNLYRIKEQKLSMVLYAESLFKQIILHCSQNHQSEFKITKKSLEKSFDYLECFKFIHEYSQFFGIITLEQNQYLVFEYDKKFTNTPKILLSKYSPYVTYK